MKRRQAFTLAAATLQLLMGGFLFAEDTDENDQALREWVNTRRQVSVKELGGSLSLTGDVHAEMQAASETVGGKQQRGHGSPTQAPSAFFDVEASILLDYRAERTWGSIKLKFDNDAGIFNGTKSKISLDRAYLGARALAGDNYTFDIEAGRRKLNQIFDSRVEFDSLFDGILFRYDLATYPIGDFYMRVGTFIINEKRQQYGYVGEIGLLQIGNTGFYTKYSVIDWDTKGSIPTQDFDFIVNQWIFGYKITPQKFNHVIEIYLAGLYNPAARKLAISNHQKQNYGGYIGIFSGELKRKGDWSIDANYQVVAAQVIPDFDAGGIGLGNVAGGGFYSTGHVPNTRKSATGNVNYRGFTITLQYLFTNNLNVFQSYSQSITLDSAIGPFRRYRSYELDLIYLW